MYVADVAAVNMLSTQSAEKCLLLDRTLLVPLFFFEKNDSRPGLMD